MVDKEEFLDVRAEIGQMMQDVSSLLTYKDDYKTRHLDLEKRFGELHLV